MNSNPGLGAWSAGQSVALLIILLLATVLRLYGLDEESLWFDEADRVFISSLPLNRLFSTMAEETLGYLPLFFLVTKPLAHPLHEAAVRYPSAISGILAVALIAQAGRKLLGARGGLIAALLLTLNPFHIWFSREANFYAPLALAAAGALYFFCCFLERPTLRNWAGLALFTGLGLWTHYFAYAIPLVGFVYLLITFRRHYFLLRKWMAAQVVAFLPLVPWYMFVIRRGEYHIASADYGPPYPAELFYSFWNFSIGYTAEATATIIVSLGLFLIALVLGMRLALKRRSPLPLFFWLPVLLAFLMSYRLAMYVDRYLIIGLPAYLLLITGGVLAAPARLQKGMLVGLVLASLLGAGRIYYDAEYYSKEDWRGVAAYIEAHEQPGDAIMPVLYQSLVPLAGVYYDGGLPFEPLLTQNGVRSPFAVSERYRRLWYVAPHYHDSIHLLSYCQPFDLYAEAGDEEVRWWLTSHQDRLVRQVDFTCVSLLLYDLESSLDADSRRN